MCLSQSEREREGERERESVHIMCGDNVSQVV